MLIPAPRTEPELLLRANRLAGRSVQEISTILRLPVPTDKRRSKGFVGALLELALGASAGSKPEPDFQAIGVELKTIPVNNEGQPRESTYVCNVPLRHHRSVHWVDSNVKRKLERVLWVPVLSGKHLSIGQCVIGQPLIWSPSHEENEALRNDWEELMDLVCTGHLSTITARHGTWLQIRPKAADSRSRQIGVETTGAPVATLPRGFYLRTAFTKRLLREHFTMPE